MTLLLVFLSCFLLGMVWTAVFAIVRDERAKDRWLEAMREMGRRCPDCGGMGWHFGPPGTGDPAISTPTCSTCKGEGKLP